MFKFLADFGKSKEQKFKDRYGSILGAPEKGMVQRPLWAAARTVMFQDQAKEMGWDKLAVLKLDQYIDDFHFDDRISDPLENENLFQLMMGVHAFAEVVQQQPLFSKVMTHDSPQALRLAINRSLRLNFGHPETIPTIDFREELTVASLGVFGFFDSWLQEHGFRLILIFVPEGARGNLFFCLSKLNQLDDVLMNIKWLNLKSMIGPFQHVDDKELVSDLKGDVIKGYCWLAQKLGWQSAKVEDLRSQLTAIDLKTDERFKFFRSPIIAWLYAVEEVQDRLGAALFVRVDFDTSGNEIAKQLFPILKGLGADDALLMLDWAAKDFGDNLYFEDDRFSVMGQVLATHGLCLFDIDPDGDDRIFSVCKSKNLADVKEAPKKAKFDWLSIEADRNLIEKYINWPVTNFLDDHEAALQGALALARISGVSEEGIEALRQGLAEFVPEPEARHPNLDFFDRLLELGWQENAPIFVFNDWKDSLEDEFFAPLQKFAAQLGEQITIDISNVPVFEERETERSFANLQALAQVHDQLQKTGLSLVGIAFDGDCYIHGVCRLEHLDQYRKHVSAMGLETYFWKD